MAYANVKDTVWTGITGRELRRHPAEVRELQFWLMCGPGRDPFGIFTFEPELVAPAIGRTAKKLRESLEVLISLEFCRWDEPTQYIWVVEMAHHQFLTPLQATDYRCQTAQKWYRDAPRNPFLGAWFDRYVDDFHLAKGKLAVERKEWAPREGASPAPSLGASMPLNNELFELNNRSGSEGSKISLPPVVDENATLKGADIDAQFERVWKVYPKAVEKKVCRAKFATLKPTIALVDEMLEAIAQQQSSEAWAKGFIPKLINWLEKGRWQDRVENRPVLTQRTAATLGAAQRFADRRKGQQG